MEIATGEIIKIPIGINITFTTTPTQSTLTTIASTTTSISTNTIATSATICSTTASPINGSLSKATLQKAKEMAKKVAQQFTADVIQVEKTSMAKKLLTQSKRKASDDASTTDKQGKGKRPKTLTFVENPQTPERQNASKPTSKQNKSPLLFLKNSNYFPTLERQVLSSIAK